MIGPALWKKLMIENLEELSSLEFQERVWRRGEGPEVSSYEEAVDQFFDVLMGAAEFNNHWRNLELTDCQWSSLKAFARMLDEFGNSVPDNSAPGQILDNPKWSNVRAKAQGVLKTLRKFLR
jgi:hypothetical protein